MIDRLWNVTDHMQADAEACSTPQKSPSATPEQPSTPQAVREDTVKYQLIEIFTKLHIAIKILEVVTNHARNTEPNFAYESTRIEEYSLALGHIEARHGELISGLDHDLRLEEVMRKVEQAVEFFEAVHADLAVVQLERVPPPSTTGKQREPITDLITDLSYPVHPWDISDDFGTVQEHADNRPEGTHFSKIRSLDAAAEFVGQGALEQFNKAIDCRVPLHLLCKVVSPEAAEIGNKQELQKELEEQSMKQYAELVKEFDLRLKVSQNKIRDQQAALKEEYNTKQRLWTPKVIPRVSAPKLALTPKPARPAGFWDWLQGCVGGGDEEVGQQSVPIMIEEPAAPPLAPKLPKVQPKTRQSKEIEDGVPSFRYTGSVHVDPDKGTQSKELEFRARERKRIKEEKEMQRQNRRRLPKHEIYGYPNDAHGHLVL